MTSWDPELYLRFGENRTRPSADLVARVALAAPGRIIDLGCGPGNSTALLRARWPLAEVVGLDSDPTMIVTAQQSGAGVRWILADAATWGPGEAYDLVFSNALIQWLPDHASLLPRFFEAVTPGGALAVQVPVHLQSPLHRDILAIADTPVGATAQQPRAEPSSTTTKGTTTTSSVD